MNKYATSLTGKTLWSEIEQRYGERARHYHTLRHLENMLNDLLQVKDHINDWDSVMIALVYHDVVYNPLSGSNEEASSDLAIKHLSLAAYPEDKFQHVRSLILATKKHQRSGHEDINYFTDADLAILGKGEAEYNEYATNVRKEYSLVPDLIYRPGRKKVLQHFLTMESIYKTDFFRHAYEINARINIQRETATL